MKRTVVRKRISAALVLVGVTALILSFGTLRSVQAATLIVSNTNDSGIGSLRDAVTLANFGDTILFDSSLQGKTITLTSGSLAITKSVTIQGFVPLSLTISGNNSFPVITNTAGSMLTLNYVKITGGYADGMVSGRQGGGIDNHGSVTLNNSWVTGNQGSRTGTYETSGGIYTETGLLNINNSMITGNNGKTGAGIYQSCTTPNSSLNITDSSVSNNSGLGIGGIFTCRPTTITRSTIYNNSASGDPNSGGSGIGGIFSALQLTINSSTISGNVASSTGSTGTLVGGIYSDLNGQTNIYNSTIDGNWGQGGSKQVGALYSTGYTGFINVTISNNHGTTASSIYNVANGGLAFSNTIIQGTSSPNCVMETTGAKDYGYNLQYPDASCAATIPVADAKLDVLRLNGGTTNTVALLPGSPAIDAGDNKACSVDPINGLDQRGSTRPLNYTGSAVDTCDIGAFEVWPASFTPSATMNATATSDTATTTSTNTATNTVTKTVSPPPSNTFTASPTKTASPIPSNTLTRTPTYTPTPTFTSTLTFTPTITPTLQAALTVNTLADGDDGSCDVTNCTLREAVAQTAAGGAITFSVTGTITLSKQITIPRSMTISGPGAASLIIDGNNVTNLFTVSASSNVTFSGLTFQRGKLTAGGTNGGAISGNQATVTVNDSVFQNNSVTYQGGAIYLSNGSLTVNNSTFTGNQSQNGAAINAYFNPTTITNSTFTNNTGRWGGALYLWGGPNTVKNSTFAGNSAGTGYGGAVWVEFGVFTITGSTFKGNSAGQGGAIYNQTTLNIGNSTFAGNQSTDTSYGKGGALYSYVGDLTLTNVTLANNSAAGAHGGGALYFNQGNATFKNTIFANNTGADGNCSTYQSVTVNLIDGGNNLQYPGTSCTSTIPVADPLLGLIQNNGGSTETMALQAGSPAIDAGNEVVCENTLINAVDQRGVTRPTDGNGDGQAICDIGAYEAPAAPVTPTSTFTPSPMNTDAPTFEPPTNTPNPTATNTDVPTATSTNTPTSTATATDTATLTPTNTATSTPTDTPTSTFTPSPTNTDAPTFEPPTNTPNPTATNTATPTGTASLTYTITPTFTATPVNGLKGDYYNNSNFTAFVMTRIDPTVNFNWGSGSPASTIGADTFSIRWTGYVQPAYSQTYTFYVYGDDGVRLWINGQQIINSWTTGNSERSGKITLTAGQKYTIKLEYFENTGNAKAILSWSSASQAKQVIPQTRLFAQ